MQLDKGTNGIFSLTYHFITCVRHCKKVFTQDDIITDLKLIIEQVSNDYDVIIINQECGEDYIHLLFKCKPTLNFKDYIQAIKGRSARYLRARYPEQFMSEDWGKHFWSPSYFLVTTGNTPLEVLEQYLNQQRGNAL